jgi:type 1 fimbria pilin
MKWSVSSLLMSAAVVGMLCIPRIAAASGSMESSGGRITFTGAIVESTCGVTAESAATWVTGVPAQNSLHQATCTGPNAAAVAAQVYRVSVVGLSDSESDRVLKYFDNYVKASGPDAKDPVLVTQIYE